MDDQINILKEMGFTKAEAEMALHDNPGNMDLAVEKLLSGSYKPPPYVQQQPSPYNSLGSAATQTYTAYNPDVPQEQPWYNSTAPQTQMPYNVAVPQAPYDSSAPVTDNHFDKKHKSHHHDTKISTLFHLNFHRKDKLKPVEDKSTAPDFFDIVGDDNQCAFNTLPPPYEKVLKEDSLKKWEYEENVDRIDLQQSNDTKLLSRIADERCSSCFNSLLDSDPSIIKKTGKFYHGDCFKKKFGPKCSYCCLLLDEPDKDHELSGLFLVYKDKNYHVECYEKYAGPRCTYCCNVIIERPQGEYSGNWVVDGSKEYHVECYQRKMYAIWKAKNS